MSKYHSSYGFYISDSIIGGIMFLGMGYVGISFTDNITAHVSIAIVAVLIVVLYARRILSRTIDIEFYEQFIVVTQVFKSRTIRIQYDDIIELQFVSVHKGPTINIMEHGNEDFREKIKFKTVAHGTGFVDFVKWLKTKNDKIKVSVYPSDDYMNHLLQEEFGFNYRKVPKLTHKS